MELHQANLDALRVTFSNAFQVSYDAAPTPLLDAITMQVSSGTGSNTYGFLAQQLVMREWLGERIVQAMGEHSYSLVNKKFEATVGIDLDDIEDDNLGIFSGVQLPQLGVAAKKYPERMMAAVLLGVSFDNFGTAVTRLGFDGKTLFASDHPCYDAAASTFDNDLDNDLTSEGLKAAMQAFYSIKGEDGSPFGVAPTHLVVPRALEWPARELLQNSFVPNSGAAVENLLKGSLTLVVSDLLDLTPTVWYLADCSKALKPLLLQNRRPVEFTSRDQLTDPEVFNKRRALYGAFWRGNAGLSLPHLIQRNTIPSASSS